MKSFTSTSLEPSLRPPKNGLDPHSPSGYPRLNSNASRFSFPPQLPPKAALALFDCLTDLVEAVWQHYESVILDQIMRELNTPPDDGAKLPLDPDDDIPF